MKQTTIIAGFLEVIGQSFSAVGQRFMGKPPSLPSPLPRIEFKDISFDPATGTLTIKNLPPCYFISVQNTESMGPLVDEGHPLCMTKAFDLGQLHNGDVIMFWRDRTTILHDLAFIGYDKKGWFGLTRGTNHFWPDFGVVRPKDVISRLVAVLYG